MDTWQALQRWDDYLDIRGMSEVTRRSYRYRIVRMAADLLKVPPPSRRAS